MLQKIHNLFLKICCWQTFRQFVKYGIVGSSTVLIDMGLLFVFTEFVGLWYMFSAIISSTAAVTFNFLMNRNWSFKSNGLVGRQMVKYLTLTAFNYFYGIGALYVFVEVFHLHYLIAKVFIAMMMVTWNFLLFKHVIYK